MISKMNLNRKNMKTDNKKGKFCPPLRDEFTKYGDRFDAGRFKNDSK